MAISHSIEIVSVRQVMWLSRILLRQYQLGKLGAWLSRILLIQYQLGKLCGYLAFY